VTVGDNKLGDVESNGVSLVTMVSVSCLGGGGGGGCGGGGTVTDHAAGSVKDARRRYNVQISRERHPQRDFFVANLGGGGGGLAVRADTPRVRSCDLLFRRVLANRRARNERGGGGGTV
jgi:hypothetical protein